jgi:hypothetical protein
MTEVSTEELTQVFAADGNGAPAELALATYGRFETPLRERLLFDAYIYGYVHEHGSFRPTNIIRTDQRWGVTLRWVTIGSLVRMVCGRWCLHIYLESIGPGPELRLPAPPRHIPLNPCGAHGSPPRVHYDIDLDVPAGTVTAAHCSTPYKCVTTVTYEDSCGTPGPVTGFVEGPILQFFNP